MDGLDDTRVLFYEVLSEYSERDIRLLRVFELFKNDSRSIISDHFNTTMFAFMDDDDDAEVGQEDGVTTAVNEKGDKIWYKNGQIHRDGDLPAIEYANGDREWYKNGQRYRDDENLPAFIGAGDFEMEWFKNGLRHRDGDLPAWITWMGTGNKRRVSSKAWYKNGQLHRDGDLPAQDGDSGDYKAWYKHGKLHRDGCKPAKIYMLTNRTVYEYWKNGIEIVGDELIKFKAMCALKEALTPKIKDRLHHYKSMEGRIGQKDYIDGLCGNTSMITHNALLQIAKDSGVYVDGMSRDELCSKLKELLEPAAFYPAFYPPQTTVENPQMCSLL
jgi:hypothetical protein